jgi:hypothetical protein
MTAANKSLEALDQRLAEKWISGIWRIPAGARPGDRKPKFNRTSGSGSIFTKASSKLVTRSVWRVGW